MWIKICGYFRNFKKSFDKKIFSDIINMFGHPKQYTRITVQRDAVFLLTLFYAKRSFYYAEKSISENGFCLSHRSCNGSRLCFLQSLRCQRKYAYSCKWRRIGSFWRHKKAGFNILTLIANWIKLVCYNFPFAFFSQLFFIQPLVRTVFKFLFRKDIAARSVQQQAV